MPTLVVNDNSWGEGIGGLLGGLSAGNDPKRRAEAMALQARIDAQNLAARQTQIENEKLVQQQKAREAAATAVEGELTPEKFYRYVPETVTQPAPSPDFMGPMPQVANPDRATLPSRLAAARTIARNAILHGTTSEGALKGAYGGLGYGQVYAAGIPKNEDEARRVTTLVEGKVPSANVPMTEQQRRVMETEERTKAEALERQRQSGAMERERLQQEQALIREREAEAGRMTRFNQGDYTVGQNATGYISAARRAALGMPAEGPIQGQVSVGPKETVIRPTGEVLRGAELPDPNAPKAPDPAFPGTGFDAAAHNKVLEILAQEERAPGSLTPAQLREYSAAHKKATDDPKWQAVEVDDPKQPGQKIKVWQQMPGGQAPLGFVPPEQLWAKYGLGAPAPAPGANPSSAPVGGPAAGPSSLTPPVSVSTPAATAVPPDQAAASTPTGGAGNVIGTTNAYQGPTEAQANSFTYTQQARQAMGEITRLYQENPKWAPQFWPGVLGAAAGAGGDQNQGPFGAMFDQATKQAVGGINTKLDPVGARIQSHEQSLLIAILRDDTGAAISPKEFGFYRDLLVPQWNDSPEGRADKLRRVDAMIAAREAQKSLKDMLAAAGLPQPRFGQVVQDNPGRFVSATTAGQAVRTAPSSEPPAAPPPSTQSPPTNPSSPQIPEGAPAGIRSGEWFFNPRTRRRERVP
jgi:hypothetical protein